MNSNTNWTPFIVVCIAFLATQDSAMFVPMCLLYAQEEEIEEEEDDEPSPRELLDERLLERDELRAELEDAEEEKSLIEANIRQLEKEIASLRKIMELQKKLERAEDDEDEDAAIELEEQIELSIEKLERMWQLGEIEAGLRELQFEMREAREENDDRWVKHLTEVTKDQNELLKTVLQLHKIYDEGPEEIEEGFEIAVEMMERRVHLKRVVFDLGMLRREEPQQANVKREKSAAELVQLHEEFLKIGKQLLAAYQQEDDEQIEVLEEKIEIVNEKLEPKWELFELEGELEEAREEGDEEWIKEIENELKAIRGETVEPRKNTTSSRPMPQPLQVGDAEIAAVAKLDFRRDVFPLLKTHCVRCHGREVQEGDLDLEQAATELPFVRNSRLWTNVAEQVKNRVMPPPGEETPTDDERRTIAAWLHNAIKNFDYSGIKEPGYEPARRLTHREYSNTVSELFGKQMEVTSKFPADLSGTSGFDNSANTLFIQPLLLERYMTAADEVVRQAMPAGFSTRDPHWKTRPDESTKNLVARFLSRAFRRPATSSEVEQSLNQLAASRKAGESFEDSLRNVARTTLVSPKFLMKIESSQSGTEAYKINDWELANRLSFFLWASMPDNELFRAARDGKLRDPTTLAEQVNRMLADRKAEALGTIFASQWLGFQHLGTRVRADPIDNPWCTDSLMDAMKAESAMFFTALVRDNQPIPRLVDAKFTFLNEELARHYGMRDIKGKEIRRVNLKTTNRGGIFTQGSLLAVTSFPGRTSPVVRGKWILDDVLGTPPPPPPPNVSEFSDEIEDRDSLTRRQKLELHRRNPNCYACHSQIDPLGFSLENYDWFGRFKTRQGRRAIDASGQLPDGTEFAGPAGLKKVIVAHRLDDLTRQLTRKMLSYALGRQLEYYDEPAVRKIVATVKNDEHRLQTLLHQIVQSYPFQFKKNEMVRP